MTDKTAGEGVVRGPITHEVKCWTVPFAAVKSGAKPWELRKNDRDYRVGDTLIQHEWEPDECRFTGDSVEHVIGWALYGPAFGLPEGYVVMSLAAQPSAGGQREAVEKSVRYRGIDGVDHHGGDFPSGPVEIDTSYINKLLQSAYDQGQRDQFEAAKRAIEVTMTDLRHQFERRGKHQ